MYAHTHMLLLSIIILLICTVLLHGTHVQASNVAYIEMNTPIRMDLPDDHMLVLRVDGIVDEVISFILLEVHTHAMDIKLSLTPNWSHGYSTSGKDIGAVAMVDVEQTSVDFYINSTVKARVLVMASAYLGKSPVPGGCNMVLDLQLDPNIQLTRTNDEVIMKFQYANFGSSRGETPVNCELVERQLRLSYDVYQYFLPSRNWEQATYLSTVENLVRPDQLRHSATKVKTVEYDKGHTLVKFAAYPGQGMIFGVIVSERDLNNNTLSASYVLVNTYTCDLSKTGECDEINDLPMQVLSCILAAFGLVLCFAGHRYFKFSMFTFGMLAFGLLAYILLARYAQIEYEYVLIYTAACGVFGGLFWLVVWCMIGLPVLSVLLAGLILGFCVTSLIFNLTPLGIIDTFSSDFNYGMAFACGVLLLPVSLLAFTRKLNLLSCTVIGSFLILVAVDSFLHSNIAYMVLNAIRKAAIPGFIKTMATLPFHLNGILLLIGWGVLVLLGLITQSFIERDQPDFPACPYDRYRERQQHQRQITQLAESRDDNERQALLGRQETRQRHPSYRRLGNVQRFQETPPEDTALPPAYSHLQESV